MDSLPLFLLSLSLLLSLSSSLDFVFNGFNSSNISLYGNASIESNILTLTNKTSFSIGRALFPSKIPTKHPNSSQILPFSTSFIFSMAPYRNTLPGHGFVFIFVPVTGIRGTSSAQHLGFLNFTLNGNPKNHVFGIEFDVFANQEFNDPNDNHVGIDLNSLASNVTGDAGFWSNRGPNGTEEFFNGVKLNSGENFQVWIDYSDFFINITMAPAGIRRPRRPLISTFLNLTDVFIDEMYIGFTSATGQLVQSHKILAWSFSNSNFSLSESLITTGLPSFVLPKEPITRSRAFIAGITVGGFLIVCILALLSGILIAGYRRRAKARAEMEDWELEYWPHRITYQEIESATKGFSEGNVIGIGGNGKVYKGVLAGNSEVAVKRISHENDGMREFLAEISSIGRLKHRNLVSLRGWCKKDRGNFLVVYDYMENGSLDKWIFDCEERKMLNFEERIRILKNVASGVLYLHEGWESRVLHRDIKASNVLLDKDMNGRLGDFGLARVHGHGQVANTTKVVGTMGYIAPEIVRTGRASSQTDVFGFGVLILEVMCGRRPIEEGRLALVDWVWELLVEGRLTSALDERLRRSEGEGDGGWSEEEVERVMHLGLLCVHPDGRARPTMRQVVKVLEGRIEGEESENENENMDSYLLQRLKSQEMWSDFSQYKTHPTFEDFLKSASTSFSWSTSIVSGR